MRKLVVKQWDKKRTDASRTSEGSKEKKVDGPGTQVTKRASQLLRLNQKKLMETKRLIRMQYG